MNDTTAPRRQLTHADRAHLFRAIDHAITYERLPGPMSVSLNVEFSSAIVQLDGDDIAGVKAWAALVKADVVHGSVTYERPGEPWHEFGTRPGGQRGYLLGWRIDLWCVVNAPSPVDAEPVEAGA